MKIVETNISRIFQEKKNNLLSLVRVIFYEVNLIFSIDLFYFKYLKYHYKIKRCLTVKD